MNRTPPSSTLRRCSWLAALAAAMLLHTACTTVPAHAPLKASLPTAVVRPVTDVHHGVAVTDPYRHFEDKSNAEVASWMKAHSDHAHATLARIEGRAGLRAAIERHDSAATARVIGITRLPNGLYFYQRRAPADDQFKLYVRQGTNGPERLLFDPEALKAQTGKPHAINYFTPSPDGRWVALGVSQGGSEDAALRFIDVASGRQVGPELPRARWGGQSWTPDSQELYFHRMQAFTPGMAETERFQRSTVALVRPGGDEASVRTVFGPGDPAVPYPATEFPFIGITPDGRALLEIRDGVSPFFRAWHSTLAQLRSGQPRWQKLFDAEDGVTNLAVQGDRVYALTFNGAPRFKLLTGRIDGFSPATAQVVVPESSRVLLDSAAAADALYLRARDGNVERLYRLPYTDGAQPTEVPLPVLGTIGFVGTHPQLPGTLLDLQSWTSARQIHALQADGRMVNTGLQPAGPFDAPADLVATEVTVRSHDGAMVPMSILHKRGVVLDGRNPTLLFGYGSYGFTERPVFRTERLAWLDAGGVFAVVNPRGSGVFGRQWHLDGQKLNKPNTWRDFIACAEYLIAQKWTSPARLGIQGGSAGGILVGRAMTERPELFAAVVPSVGALDTLRAEFTANGVPNIPEFGSVTTPEGFKALQAMSTYANIRDGVRYPAVLLTHGVNDPRVEVWQSTKTAARLMAASASGKPVLLRLDYDAGHGIGNTKAQQYGDRADLYAFLLWQMGVPGYALKP